MTETGSPPPRLPRWEGAPAAPPRRRQSSSGEDLFTPRAERRAAAPSTPYRRPPPAPPPRGTPPQAEPAPDEWQLSEYDDPASPAPAPDPLPRRRPGGYDRLRESEAHAFESAGARQAPNRDRSSLWAPESDPDRQLSAFGPAYDRVADRADDRPAYRLPGHRMALDQTGHNQVDDLAGRRAAPEPEPGQPLGQAPGYASGLDRVGERDSAGYGRSGRRAAEQADAAAHPGRAQHAAAQPAAQAPAHHTPGTHTPGTHTPGTHTPGASSSGSSGALSLGLGRGSHERELIRRVGFALTGTRRVVVVSIKGGVGKTTTVAVVGSLLAGLRRDKVVALDASSDWGTLAARLSVVPRQSVRDLAAR
ncbi:MAG TPA: hypothetical protein VEL73_04975, partial [Mycobacteriales bacterium]|nr:hypothetical protein [Mycobacteriales bacterium]